MTHCCHHAVQLASSMQLVCNLCMQFVLNNSLVLESVSPSKHEVKVLDLAFNDSRMGLTSTLNVTTSDLVSA